jgi:beta-lactamase regulating signal transducer with metallopeptidase domain
MRHFVTSYDVPQTVFVPATISAPQTRPPELSLASTLLFASAMVSVGLLTWLVIRWWQVRQLVRSGSCPQELSGAVEAARQQANSRSQVRLRIVDDRMSPALCGLFHPVILLPRTLADRLSPAQLRIVLLHELFHLRRHDMWVNFAQTLLQIFYWWHPLLWVANARIRHVRGQAVDDAVMLALNDNADDYAPTLLEVACITFRRQTINLGLVGIMESRSALRHRIERLVNFSAPRKAGLTVASLCAVFVFSAAALPMGEAPEHAGQSALLDTSEKPLVSVTFALSEPANWAALKQRISESGQQPPYLFFRNNGLVFARGTPKQLISVEQSVLELNGLATTQLEDFAKELLLKQAEEGAETNLYSRTFKVDSAKLLPVLKEVFQDNLDAFLRVAPETTALIDFPDQGTQFGPKQSPPGPPVRPGFPDKESYIGPEQPPLDVAFHTLAKGMGLEMNVSGKSLFYVEKQNILFMKGTLSDFNAIEAILQTLLNMRTEYAPPAIAAPLNIFNLRSWDASVFLINTNGNSSTNLYSAVFKVDPAFVSRVLKEPIIEATKGRETSGDTDDKVTEALRSLFTSRGVDLKAPGKIIKYNRSVDLLFIEATASDLTVIESAAPILPNNSPQLHIKSRFYQVPESFFSTSAYKSMPADVTDGVGVLTRAEAKTFLRALDSHYGFDGFTRLADPEITTTSGRHTIMRSTDFVNVVTNFISGENPTNHEVWVSAHTGQIETGPKFDVVPHLLTDGHTLNLYATASAIEFAGYADGTNLVPDTFFTNSAGETRVLPIVLPAVELSRETANRNLFDGQSLVLFPKSENVLFTKPNQERDERVAEHIRKWEKSKRNPQLVVVVTVDIVDTAGKRFYGDGDWAFPQDQIPKQPPD